MPRSIWRQFIFAAFSRERLVRESLLLAACFVAGRLSLGILFPESDFLRFVDLAAILFFSLWFILLRFQLSVALLFYAFCFVCVYMLLEEGRSPLVLDILIFLLICCLWRTPVAKLLSSRSEILFRTLFWGSGLWFLLRLFKILFFPQRLSSLLMLGAEGIVSFFRFNLSIVLICALGWLFLLFFDQKPLSWSAGRKHPLESWLRRLITAGALLLVILLFGYASAAIWLFARGAQCSQVTENVKVPDFFVVQLLLREDRHFFEHRGIDFSELRESIDVNLRERGYVRGASTISMQLAKLLYLEKEKNISRKLLQSFLAMLLELRYSKAEILQCYLSIIDFAEKTYGISAAANHYYAKSAEELSERESAELVASIANPNIFNPRNSRNPQSALRVQRVLQNVSGASAELRRHVSSLSYVSRSAKSPTAKEEQSFN